MKTVYICEKYMKLCLLISIQYLLDTFFSYPQYLKDIQGGNGYCLTLYNDDPSRFRVL